MGRSSLAVLALTAACLGADLAGAASWTTTTPLPDAYRGHALVYSSNRLFHTGGVSYSGGIVDGTKVFSAPASDAGTVGAWTSAAALPEAVYYHAGAAVNGHLYVLGGFHYTDADGMAVSNVVYHGKIGADGAVGAWQTATPLPQPVFFASAAAWNGRIYVTGGWNGSALVSAVYSAEVQADGSLGLWVAQKSLPQAVYTHAAVSNGTLYVLGGTVNGGNDIQNSVYFAKINADGSLADWAATTPLPSPVSNHGAVVANGRVLVLGGWTGTAPTAAVHSSLIVAGGGLGGWAPEALLPRPLYLLASAASASHIFVSGGIDDMAIRSEFYSLPLPPPPPPADALPPRTSLAFSGPLFGGVPFISTATAASLSAVDDASIVGDGAGIGVAGTQWALDDGVFAAYTAPIRVPTDGGHWIRFWSVDTLGHAETMRASSAAVDGTAPVSALSVGAPRAVLTTGEIIVGPATGIAVAAVDPVVNGAASGVARTLAAVDGGALAASTAPFVLPAVDGAHTVLTQAVDNVGNAEAAHAATVYRDAIAPVSALALSSPAYAAEGGAPFLGGATLLSFSAQDPAGSGGVAAGVNRTEYSLGGAAAEVYNGPFGLPEGSHTVTYHSLDNVANAEASRSVSFLVDATAPRTTLSFAAGAALFGEDMITPDSAVSLAAEDPVSAGAASGVERIVYSVDGGADRVYTAPFRLPAGRHTVGYGAVDHAGNAEPRNAATLSVGAFLIDALSATGKIELSGKAGVVGVVRTNSAFTADGKSFVDGDVAGMTVTLSDRSTVSGAIIRGRATVVSPAYDLDAARTWAKAHNDNAVLPARLLHGGALTLDGRESVTLPAGDYYLTGLRLRGKSSLSVSGRVNIFLDGPLTVRGGSSLNGSGDAGSLWVVSADESLRAYERSGDDDERDEQDDDEDRREHDYGVFLNGKSRAAFNLYAPFASVRALGKGQFAGRVLAKTVSLSGKTLQPSTTALPPSKRAPKPSKPHPPIVTREGGGTGGRGHADGREAAVASSRLEREEPRREPSGGAVLPPIPDRTAAAPDSRGRGSRTAPSRMPSFPLAARAAFAAVGREANAVRAKDRSAVVIPEGATTTGLGVSVSPPKKSDVLENQRRAGVEARKGLVAASSGVQYGPEGARFTKPVTLELPYDRASLPAGVSENGLCVHYWNPVNSDWEKLDSSVDTQNQIVRAQTTHFSLYQIFGGGASATINDWSLRAAYAFPNPARDGGAVTIRIQPGLADSVEVHIYDPAGRKVHSSSDFGFSVVGAQKTYDHVWDTSGAAVGVYTFVIRARQAGQADIGKTGKIGVIK